MISKDKKSKLSNSYFNLDQKNKAFNIFLCCIFLAFKIMGLALFKFLFPNCKELIE